MAAGEMQLSAPSSGWSRARHAMSVSWLIYVAAILVAIWIVGPFLWTLKSSFSPQNDLLSVPPQLIPHHWTLDNYKGLFATLPGTSPGQEQLIPGELKNSLIIASSVLALNLLFGAPAAYVLARGPVRFRRGIVNGLLASRMVPALVLLVPFYLLFRRAHLIDSLQGVVIAHLAISLPFTIWILRGHFARVPLELERAARVDGCGRLRTFQYVALPLTKAGLAVAGLFAFMVSWNEFPLALVLTASPRAFPVQPALAGLYSLQGATYLNYGYLFSATVLSAGPPAVIALLLQKHFRQGALAGAVK